MNPYKDFDQAVRGSVVFWVLRFVVGACIGVLGLMVLQVNLDTLGALRGIGGLTLLGVAFGVMPNLFSRK